MLLGNNAKTLLSERNTLGSTSKTQTNFMYIFQLQRSIHMFSKLTRSTRFANVLREWHILKEEVPKGFEKYFGKKTPAKSGSKQEPQPSGARAPPRGRELVHYYKFLPNYK